MLRSSGCFVLAVLVVFLEGRCEAASLKVSPGRFTVHDVRPGQLYDIYKESGLRLSIFNDDAVSRTWVLSTYRPSERGRWEKAYGEIPDASWCWFSEEEVTVPPNSQGYAYLHLQIPDMDKYYNQHWVATLGVAGKSGAGGVSLAVDVRVQIDTKSKADAKGVPEGILGMKPSTVRFEDVVPGTRREASVTLFNNDTRAHDYAISSLFEDKKIKRPSYLMKSYSEIPDFSWIARDEHIRIEPGSSAELRLGLQIPSDEAHAGQKWEDMVLIQPDEGRAEFVRVQVDTQQETGAR